MTTETEAALADQDRKGPGRPRSARVDEAIIEAVLDLLAEGTAFDALSIEAVAARAGVGKATIYRRWPNKEALLLDAVATVKGEPAQLLGGTVREDLVALLRPMSRAAQTRAGRIMPCLLAELQRSAELRGIYDRITNPRREVMRSVLRRGIQEGSLRPDLDVEAAMAMLAGPMVAKSLMPSWAPEISREELPERLVAAIWPAIAA
jgi:AcrR family transcriptional regulator